MCHDLEKQNRDNAEKRLKDEFNRTIVAMHNDLLAQKQKGELDRHNFRSMLNMARHETKIERVKVTELQADQVKREGLMQLLWDAARLLELQAKRIDFEGEREPESDYELELLDCKALLERMHNVLG